MLPLSNELESCWCQKLLDSAHAPKAWFNQGLPGCKPGWPTRLLWFSNQANQTLPNVQKAWLIMVFLVSLVYLRTRKTRLKPGLWNSEWTMLTRLEPYVQKAWLTMVFLVSLVSLVYLRTRKTRLKPGLWNSEWTMLTRLEPYVQKAWLTMVFLVSLVSLVYLRTRKTRLKPGLWNSEWTMLTRLKPYVKKAWLTMVFPSLSKLVWHHLSRVIQVYSFQCTKILNSKPSVCH